MFHDFTSFGAGQAGSSEMDSAKFVKLAKVHFILVVAGRFERVEYAYT